MLDVTEMDVSGDHHFMYVRHPGFIQVCCIALQDSEICMGTAASEMPANMQKANYI